MKRLRADEAAEGLAERLSTYLADVVDKPLEAAVSEKAQQHLLDTLGACLSGSRLKPGRLAIGYARTLGSAPQAGVIGSRLRRNAAEAALCNGVMAHADETDDSHLGGRFHPGCAIVPATLALGQTIGSSGRDLLAAIAAGYDLGARMSRSLGYATPDAGSHSSHCLGAVFGAGAGSIALCRFSPRAAASAQSYLVQQASGIRYWQRDREHVEKAFDFGGMGARNGVYAATLVRAGFSGVADPFTGRHSMFTAFADDPLPEQILDGLGETQGIMDASMKKWSVGSPIQAALDSLEALLHTPGVDRLRIAQACLELPDDRAGLVDNRAMPDICLQHLAALMLVDGTVTFQSSHDYARLKDQAVLDARQKVELRPSAELTEARPARQARITITMQDGQSVTHRTRAVRGTPDNPMDTAEIEAKFRDLTDSIIGAQRARSVIDAVRKIETMPDVRALMPMLTA